MTSLAYTRTRRSVGEQAIRYGLLAAAAVSVLTTILIVLSLLRETISFFGDVPLGDFLFGTKWTPLLAGDQQSFGVIPLIVGTLYLTAIGLSWRSRSGCWPRSTSRSTRPSACARSSSRCWSCWPACRRSCSATSR